MDEPVVCVDLPAAVGRGPNTRIDIRLLFTLLVWTGIDRIPSGFFMYILVPLLCRFGAVVMSSRTSFYSSATLVAPRRPATGRYSWVNKISFRQTDEVVGVYNKVRAETRDHGRNDNVRGVVAFARVILGR